MIFLLNHERVFSEIFELSRMLIAQKLSLPLANVHVKVEVVEGKLTPRFEIKQPTSGPLEEKIFRDVTAEVWALLKRELLVRLAGLQERRYGWPGLETVKAEAAAPSA